MEISAPYYVSKLKERLSEKQKFNPPYSLRAFSRDIGVHHGTLGQVLKGQRPLPFKVAENVINRLMLGPKERTLFRESLLRSKLSIDSIKIDSLDERFMLDESYYKVIAEWEHAAILELFNVHDCKVCAEEVSERLSIPLNRAEVAITNLRNCGLVLEGDDGLLVLAHPELRTTEDIKSQALKESHKETLRMGIEKLESIEVELRDFSSTTVALNLDKIPEAKTIIREFRMKMSALLRESDPKTDVYQLAIQFFPLTNTSKL